MTLRQEQACGALANLGVNQQNMVCLAVGVLMNSCYCSLRRDWRLLRNVMTG